MTEIIGFDKASARIRERYEQKLAEKQLLIEEQAKLLERQRETLALHKGSAEMLRLQLADLSTKLAAMSEQISLAMRNVQELRGRLPEFPD